MVRDDQFISANISYGPLMVQYECDAHTCMTHSVHALVTRMLQGSFFFASFFCTK